MGSVVLLVPVLHVTSNDLDFAVEMRLLAGPVDLQTRVTRD